jgi:hypothetical protein
MCLKPMHFGDVDNAIALANKRLAFHLAPPLSAISIPKPIAQADAPAGGDDVNIVNRADDVEVARSLTHAIFILSQLRPREALIQRYRSRNKSAG